jgi:uncharacterized protein YciI
MLFVLMGLDRKGDGAEIRRQNRAAHLQFVVENEDKFRYGGALLDDAQKMVGSLMMVELPDRQALEEFLKTEPYSRAGLFEPYVVKETRQVVPQRQPGFLAAELAKEKARPD